MIRPTFHKRFGKWRRGKSVHSYGSF